jgi:antirestriction protein ArdC
MAQDTLTKDKRLVAHDRLNDAIERLVEDEEWMKWLNTRAAFHNYSFNNTLLIACQRPDATQVAGFRQWQALGRQVRKGEKGIAILAPMVKKVEDEAGELHRKVYGFRTVYVFDIAQTDGEPLPESPVVKLTGDAGLRTFEDALRAHADAEGLSIIDDADNLGSANGMISRDVKTVYLAAGLAPDQRVKTLIHELAHWHDLGDPTKQEWESRFYDRDAAEITAESCAYIVASHVGLDTSDYSLGYVAAWADGNVEKIRGLAERVDGVARVMLKALTIDGDDGAAEAA